MHGDDHFLDPVRDDALNIARAKAALLGQVAQNFAERHPNPAQLRRDAQKIAILPVPAHQMQVFVEHRNSLADMVDGRFKEVAAILDGLGGIDQKPARAAGLQRLALQGEGQHQPGRCVANGAGQKPLGKPAHLGVGFVVVLNLKAALGGVFGKTPDGALGPQIAHHGGFHFANRNIGPRQAKIGRGDMQALAGEYGRLKPLFAPGLGHQGDRDITDEIGRQAPHNPVGQRVGIEEKKQRFRPQKRDAEGAIEQNRIVEPARINE